MNMNTIQQISLKLQLGLDPAANIHPDQLLQKWQAFSEKKCKRRLAAGYKPQHRTGLAPSTGV
jgi:hypothetical protein